MRKHYKEGLAQLKKKAYLKINALVIGHKVRRKYRMVMKVVYKMQANFFATQNKRSFQKLKCDAIQCQAYIRRYLAVTWFKKIHSMKRNLEDKMELLNDQIGELNTAAKEFKESFVNKSISEPLKYLTSFEKYQLKNQTGSHLQSYVQLTKEAEELKKENEMLKAKIAEYEDSKDPGKKLIQRI